MTFYKISVTKISRCIIDFLATPEIDSGRDIVFHTSIRLNEKCLIRNSFISQRWGPEERYGQFGISYNKPFEIIFLAEFEHYKIAVNGTHIGVFRHRLPLHLVNFIRVSGEVKIDHILLEQDMSSAQVHQAISAITTSMPANHFPIHVQPSMPASNHFPIYTQPPSYSYQPTPASAPPIQVSYQPPTSYQQQQNPYDRPNPSPY